MPFTQNVAKGLFDIVPSDTVELAKPANALRVSVGGNLAITDYNGNSPAAFVVVAGEIINVRVKFVLATGTTATVQGYEA